MAHNRLIKRAHSLHNGQWLSTHQTNRKKTPGVNPPETSPNEQKIPKNLEKILTIIEKNGVVKITKKREITP